MTPVAVAADCLSANPPYDNPPYSFTIIRLIVFKQLGKLFKKLTIVIYICFQNVPTFKFSYIVAKVFP